MTPLRWKCFEAQLNLKDSVDQIATRGRFIALYPHVDLQLLDALYLGLNSLPRGLVAFG